MSGFCPNQQSDQKKSQKKTFFYRRGVEYVKTMLFSILFGRFVLISYLCKDFPLKFFSEIFGGYRKNIYLCNRKRETNAAHDERCGSLSKIKKKEFFERFT